MKKNIRLLCLSVFILSSFLSQAFAKGEFKINNPDGHKYEFGRSYISALSYFSAINDRWSKNPPKKKYKGDDTKTIKGSMQYLVQDNIDLRIAKNYMIKYMEPSNPLMRKVADMMIVVCDTDIALNNKAKNLWQDLYNLKGQGPVDPKAEKNFIKLQKDLELKRKESDKSIIQASVLMTKVLLSQDNRDDKGFSLAVTSQQRTKLLDLLDVYGKDVLDWGLKPGQSTFQASVAVIREVLEDPVYTAHK